MIDTWILETEQGVLSITETPTRIYKVSATIAGQTVQFNATIAGLWTFPRVPYESHESHFKRYIMHRLVEAQRALTLDYD